MADYDDLIQKYYTAPAATPKQPATAQPPTAEPAPPRAKGAASGYDDLIEKYYAPPPGAPTETGGGFRDALSGEFEFQAGLGKGLARGGTKFIGNIAELFGKKLPEGMQKFADAPAESAGEEFGSPVGEYGSGMLVGGGLGGLVEGAIGGTVTPWLGAAASRLNALRGTLTGPAAAYRNVISRLAGPALPKAVGAVTGGAAGGAIANPEQPGLGALAGAAGGPVPMGVGKIFSSPVGREIGGHALRGVAAFGAYEFLKKAGLPAEPAWIIAVPNIRWLRSPVGGKLHRVGNWLTDTAGNVVAKLPPSLTGQAAGQAAGVMTKDE